MPTIRQWPDVARLSVAKAAEAYARAGFAVVPVQPATKNAGSILGVGWPAKSSRDVSTVRNWWRKYPDAGIGIHTGASRIVVFDLDIDSVPGELEPLRRGLIHRTRADSDSERGHYVFDCSDVFTSGALRLANGTKVGEIRSGNTIVVVEPTPHANGGLYRCNRPGDLAMLTTEARRLLVPLPSVGNRDVDSFLAAYTGNEADNLAYCSRSAVKRYTRLVDSGKKNRHDAMYDVLCLMLKEAHAQAYSATKAVGVLRKRWAESIAGDSSHDEREFDRMLPDAVAVANADDPVKRRGIMARTYGTDTRNTDANWSAYQARRQEQVKVKHDGPIEDQYTKGQVRMARALCSLYDGKLIFVPEIGWHYWDSTRWCEDTLGRVTQCVLKTLERAMKSAKKKWEKAQAENNSELDELAGKLWDDALNCQTATGIDGITKLARTWPGFATPPKALDADPYALNLQDCTVNLKTGEKRDHDPTDLITKVCNAKYAPDADCPVWSEYLTKVLPDNDVRLFVQQLMGLALVGLQLEHILVIFKGNGRNGKGVFEETMRHVLGDYAVTAASDLFTAKPNAHTTSQTDLMGSRLAIIDETESDARLSEALLKKMTGGGTHTARRMRQDNVRFPMTWLPVMITNYLPQVTSQGADIWDRLVIVDFPTYFAPDQQDKFLREKLKSETDGIFMWAYRGWLAYQNAGYKLALPSKAIEAAQEYRHSQDKLQLWLDTRCQLGTGDLFRSKPADLLGDYNEWASRIGDAERLGKKVFLDLLQRKNFRYLANRARLDGVRLDPNRPELPGAIVVASATGNMP